MATTYSFRGRPDFDRMVRENPSANILVVSAGGYWNVVLVRDADALLDSAMRAERGHSYPVRIIAVYSNPVDGRPTFNISVNDYSKRPADTPGTSYHAVPEGWGAYTFLPENREAVIREITAWQARNKAPRVTVTALW